MSEGAILRNSALAFLHLIAEVLGTTHCSRDGLDARVSFLQA